MGLLVCFLGLWQKATKCSLQRLLKSVSLFAVYRLVGLLDTNPIGFQSWMFKGLVPHLRVLNVSVLAVGPTFFAPPYWTEMRQEWGLWRVCLSLSYQFKVGISSPAYCVGVTQLVFELLPPTEMELLCG